jgi:hypothetical protein
MTALQRVIVIMEQGRIVGTQIAPDGVQPGTTPSDASARLRAGPGQTMHEVHVAVPADLASPEARDRFHAILANEVSAKK